MTIGHFVKPIKIGVPLHWSRLQHLYWRALHVIWDFPYAGPSRYSEPFDYMLSLKEEILRNRSVDAKMEKILLDDFEKHIHARDINPRKAHFLSGSGAGFGTQSWHRFNSKALQIYPHGTPNPFPKVCYNDDGPLESF
eukprot:NODE_6462_length_532_cov_21.740741_g6297_i0.p1 GENE.NODE_6462_length_532_cov_21.740741_g6297_i0~~NODE_6462_length_532_cov_21.740741_g6297_i0.p1  ORF type:complete len:138 (+),score=27.16 NODE_6462_length_532_cov_21.740741_g6297_i0:58-471(+)